MVFDLDNVVRNIKKWNVLVLVFFSIIALFHANKCSYSQAPGNFSVIRKRYNNYWLKYTFNNHLVEWKLCAWDIQGLPLLAASSSKKTAPMAGKS